jgi:hypothetical protein
MSMEMHTEGQRLLVVRMVRYFNDADSARARLGHMPSSGAVGRAASGLR